MCIKKSILGGLLLSFSLSAIAAGNWQTNVFYAFNSNSISSKSSKIYINKNSEPDTFVSSLSGNNAFSVGISGYYGWKNVMRSVSWFGVGFRYGHSSNFSVNGYDLELSDPKFNNYTYHYHANVNSYLMMAKAEFLPSSKWVKPFVELGLGWASITSSQYHLNNRPGIPVLKKPGTYSGNTDSNIAYLLGAGVNVRLSQQLSAGLAYEYQDNGFYQAGSSENSQGQVVAGPKQRLTSSSVVLMLGYNFD